MTLNRRDTLDFSFSNFADGFDDHIRKSIRGYDDLISDCICIGDYFIEKETSVLDIGFSAGTFLRQLRQQNKDRVKDVRYLGDVEDNFASYWTDPNIEWVVSDIRYYNFPSNCSFITSIFSLQIFCRESAIEYF